MIPRAASSRCRRRSTCDWFRDVAANVAAILAADGSYFLNIKEHADDGERSLYVKDLVHRAPAAVGLAVRR